MEFLSSTIKKLDLAFIKEGTETTDFLISQIAELEQENYDLKVKNLNLQRMEELESSRIQSLHKIESLELENMKLQEANDFLKSLLSNQSSNLIPASSISTLQEQVVFYENEMEMRNEELSKFQNHNKILAEQLKSSNSNFANLTKKLSFCEKERSLFEERLKDLEKERDSLSIKWQLASGKLKGEGGLKERLKRLEAEVREKETESKENFNVIREKDEQIKKLNERISVTENEKHMEIAEKERVQTNFASLQNKVELMRKELQEKQTQISKREEENPLIGENMELKLKNSELEKEIKEISQQTLELTNLRKQSKMEHELQNRKLSLLTLAHERLLISHESLKESQKLSSMSVATNFKTLKETQLSQILANSKYLEILSFAARIETLIKERTSFQKIEFLLKEKVYNLLEEICERGYIMLKYQELHDTYQQINYKLKRNEDDEIDERDENYQTGMNNMSTTQISMNRHERAKSVYLNIDSLANRNGITKIEGFNSKINNNFNYLQNIKNQKRNFISDSTQKINQQIINGRKEDGIKLKLSDVLNRKDKKVKLLCKEEDRLNQSFDFVHKNEIKRKAGYMEEHKRKKDNRMEI